VSIDAVTDSACLLYFGSRTSGPSRRMEAFVDQILQERRNHRTFRRQVVDIERHPEVARRFAVVTVPTILVVDNDRVVRRIEGRVSVPELRRALAPWLA
jgi:thioredoxin-like negative regulator of GroEL